MVPAALARPRLDGPLGEAWLALRSGRVRLANSHLTLAARQHDAGELPLDPIDTAVLRALIVDGRLAVGDLDGAEVASEPLRQATAGDDAGATAAHLALGEVAAALGDHAQAERHFTTAGTLPPVDLIRPWRTGAALALVWAGRRREAVALAREQVAMSGPDSYARAFGLRTLAVADTAHDAVAVLRSARDVVGHTPDRRLLAQIETDMAGLMLLDPIRHPRAEAVELLRRSELYGAGEGLWPLHSRVVRLLERAGEHALPLEGETLAQLTAAERRVARLAADGLTNRQIAERLSLTVKGVEWHLSRTYRKLGIGSRAGLAGLLATGLAS